MVDHRFAPYQWGRGGSSTADGGAHQPFGGFRSSMNLAAAFGVAESPASAQCDGVLSSTIKRFMRAWCFSVIHTHVHDRFRWPETLIIAKRPGTYSRVGGAGRTVTDVVRWATRC